jgi:hypothetical protein
VGDELAGTLLVWENNVRRERAFRAERILPGAAAAAN